MPSDEIFGRDKSRSFNNLETARQYYEKLSSEYKQIHESHNSALEFKKTDLSIKQDFIIAA